jgi:pyruvate formate-lyase activating enzyme-like uncharacterized protein
MDEKIKEYCTNHSIMVIDQNKRAHRMTRANISYFQFPDDYNRCVTGLPAMETEPLWTVEITPSELKRMADFENQVFNYMKESGHYNMFEVLMDQKKQEQFLKEKYPAVKKAYEHYSLMLKLAESGEL